MGLGSGLAQRTPTPTGPFIGSRGVSWILKAKCTEIITFQANPIKTSSRLVGPRCGKYQCRNSGKGVLLLWTLTCMLAAVGGRLQPRASQCAGSVPRTSLSIPRGNGLHACDVDSLMNDHFICSINSWSSHFYSFCTIDALRF